MRTLLAVLLIVTLFPTAAVARGRGGCSGGFRGGYSRPVQLAPGRGWGYTASYSRPCYSRPVYYSRPLYYSRPYVNTGYFYGNTPYFTPYGFYGAGYGGTRYASPSYQSAPVVQEAEVEEVEPAEGDDKPNLKLPDVK